MSNPAAVRALAGALKMAGEFGLAVEITYNRLGKSHENPPLLTDGDEQDTYTISPIEQVVEGDYQDIQPIE
jgi:hypothetical protein